MTKTSHDKISPTAKFVAYFRALAKMPYSQEIATACNAEAAFKEIVGEKAKDLLWMAPMIEARDASTDAALRRYGHGNILELAAGLSPRGLIWTEDPKIRYIHTDLPDILEESKRVMLDILRDQKRKRPLWLPLNVLIKAHFSAIGEYFDGPIAVVNEGLLPYLSREEKARVASNIHRLLKKHGGVWITSDVIERATLEAMLKMDPVIAQVMQAISGFTGRNLEANSFASLADAEQFFAETGFKVIRWSQRELIPHLFSRNVDHAKVVAMLERINVWAMEVL